MLSFVVISNFFQIYKSLLFEVRAVQKLAVTFRARSSRGLATEFSPLAQNENRKIKRTMNRKPAIAFDACYEL